MPEPQPGRGDPHRGEWVGLGSPTHCHTRPGRSAGVSGERRWSRRGPRWVGHPRMKRCLSCRASLSGVTPPGDTPACHVPPPHTDPAPRGPMVGDTHRAPRGTHVPGVVAVDGECEGSSTSHGPPEHGAVTEDVAVVDSVWEELGGKHGAGGVTWLQAGVTSLSPAPRKLLVTWQELVSLHQYQPHSL